MSEPISPAEAAALQVSAPSSLVALFQKAKEQGGFEYLYA